MASNEKPKVPLLRARYRLAGQSIAFVTMMVAPLAMYCAVQAGATGWLTAGLAAMGTSMALAMWVS